MSQVPSTAASVPPPLDATSPYAAVDVSLRDRTVLLHGSTGTVGAALIGGLGQQGARVGAVVRRRWQVERIEQSLSEAGIPRSRQLVGVVDSEDSEAARGFAKGVEDSLGPIYALVSAAGAFSFAAVGEESAEVAGEQWRANFTSVHTLVRAVVSPMRRRGAGMFVFTGARAVVEPPRAGLALYLASKVALHTYAACLAYELAPHGVGVAVLAPTIIDGEANRRAMPDADRSAWLQPATVAARLLELAAAPPRPPDDILVVCP